MKKFIIIFLILIGVQSLSAQFSTMFNDTLRPFGMGGDGFAKVIEDSNSYFALSFLNSSIGQYPYLLKLDEYGGILKKKLYVDTNYNYAIYPYNSMVKRNNIILFCGQVWGGNGNLGFVMAINKFSLDTLWTRTYTHPDTVIAQTASDVFSVLTAIKSTPDGGYILTGNYNKNCITGNLRSFLMKIDSVGNVEWRRIYSIYYTFFDIEVAQDSGYFIPCTLNGGSIYLIKVNKEGNYEWRVKVNSNSNQSYPVDVSLLNNNSVIVASSYWYDLTNYLRAVTVTKVSLFTNNVVWEKNYHTYNSFECFTVNQAMGVKTLSDGSIIVSGSADRYGYDAVILKLNSNGDSLWCRSYDFEPDPWDCQLNDLIVTDDGGFMGVGFWSDQSGPGWTAWMFKTDANGYVGMRNELVISNQELVIYPNPASEKLIIEITDNKSQTALLEIYNSEGKRIMNTEHRIRNVEVNVSSWSAGVYFGRIIFETGESKGFKFVVE